MSLKEDVQKTELFEEAPISKAVATLAIPTAATMLVMMLYTLADTLFVGMINDPIQNAAVTLASPVILAFNAINNLFGVGSSSLISRSLGSKHYEVAQRTSAFGFYCAIISGIIFSLAATLFRPQLLTLLGADETTREATAAYLFWTATCGAVPAILNVVMGHLVRAEGSSLHAAIGTMSGAALNIVLDPIFILGFNMGAQGAGLATFLSNSAACVYFLILFYVKRNRTYLSIHPRHFGLQADVVKGVFAVGIPASIQNILNVTGMTVLNNFASAYAAEAVAAMGIAYKINMIPMYLSMGIGQGIMPLVSYNYASKNYKRMRKAFTFTLKIALVITIVFVVIFQAGAETLISLFMKNETIIAYGAAFLRGYSLGIPFLCIDFLAVGVFQATGMGHYALIFAILRKIVLEIPAMIILNHFYPLYGLAYSQFLAEFVLAVIAAVVLTRFFKKHS